MATQTIDEPTDRGARIAAIAADPGLREEAARVLPELSKLMAHRGSNDQFYGVLQPLLITKTMPDFGDGEAGKRLTQAWLAVYYEQLRKFPLAAVHAGVKAYIGAPINRYPAFPQPGELCAFIAPYAEKIRTAHYRLKDVLKIEARAQTDIDRRANHQRMAEAGWLDADGKFDIKRCMSSVKRPPAPARPTESQQAMAARIRGGA